jgi:hypothetical protein
MSGIIFLGMMVGTFLATFFGDDHGRIYLLRIALGILLIGGMSSAFMPEF